MPVSFVQVKADSTGKKLRSYDDGTGANALYAIFNDERNKVGLFKANTGIHQISLSAHTSTQGYWWLVNPTGSGRVVSFDYIHFLSHFTANSVLTASPRITLERCSYAGALSGTLVTPADRNTSEVNSGQVRTSGVGTPPATMTAGPAFFSMLPQVNFTTTAAQPRAMTPAYTFGQPPWDSQISLVEGECVVCRQADGGSAADGTVRIFTTSIEWTEYTLP